MVVALVGGLENPGFVGREGTALISSSAAGKADVKSEAEPALRVDWLSLVGTCAMFARLLGFTPASSTALMVEVGELNFGRPC